MGLSNFPSAAEGVLPVLVINTVLSVTLLKNLVRSVFQVMSSNGNPPSLEEEQEPENGRERRISITQYKSLSHRSNKDCSRIGCGTTVECCVCLCGFEADEEVSELSCKHFFHKGCLATWFDSKHTTCPLCRSVG